MIENKELAKRLQTCIKKNPEDKNFYGLTESEAEKKLKDLGPN